MERKNEIQNIRKIEIQRMSYARQLSENRLIFAVVAGESGLAYTGQASKEGNNCSIVSCLPSCSVLWWLVNCLC